MTEQAQTARFDIGRVIARAFGPIGRNFPLFFGLAFVLVGIPGLLSAWADLDESSSTAAVASVLGTLVGLVTTYVLQAALVYGSVLDLRGQRARLSDILQAGGRMFLPVLGLSILYGIAVGLGFIFLIVPGLIMMTVWSVAVPALVMERTGVFGAFDRSRNLTRNHRWSIFGLLVLYFIVALLIIALAAAVGGVLALGDGGLDNGETLIGLIVMVLGQTLGAMIGASGAAALYVELRQIKEGAGVDELAAVFA